MSVVDAWRDPISVARCLLLSPVASECMARRRDPKSVVGSEARVSCCIQLCFVKFGNAISCLLPPGCIPRSIEEHRTTEGPLRTKTHTRRNKHKFKIIIGTILENPSDFLVSLFGICVRSLHAMLVFFILAHARTTPPPSLQRHRNSSLGAC